MRVAVDQAGQQRLAAPVVDLGLWILREHLRRGPDGGNPIADHGERHVVAHLVHGHDGGVGEHHGPCRYPGLCLRVARIEEQSGGAGAREQFTSTQIGGWHGAP